MEQQKNSFRSTLSITLLKFAALCGIFQCGISSFALGVINPSLLYADAQNDFDSDGISDITYRGRLRKRKIKHVKPVAEVVAA